MQEVPFRIKPTDREILRLLREGMEPKMIARKLKLPFKLVKQKIRKLRRLGVTTS